ncbi:hypothetical protein NPIL_6731 [Nephila pilipes]|uniref:Uncharacterized protein n=1 Tax=Nephila pilipes TaxID=299642 RepID=A0A8X6Q424_NEPPI|nr:hypothetical protein NPIL_6731 [Nephila pilipes]
MIKEARVIEYTYWTIRMIRFIEDNQKENNVTVTPLPSTEIININEESNDEQGNASKIESLVLPKRSSRSNKGKPLERLYYLANENKNNPENYKEALSRIDKYKWKKIENFLEKISVKDCKPTCLPIDTSYSKKEDNTENLEDDSEYRQTVYLHCPKTRRITSSEQTKQKKGNNNGDGLSNAEGTNHVLKHNQGL